MKRLILPLLVLVTLAWGLRWTSQAFEVAVGYSAKQLCSGVFVARLEPDFIIENDIHLSMGVLGPLLSKLKLDVDKDQARTRASLLGAEAEAAWSGQEGCVLNPEEEITAPDKSGLQWIGMSGFLEAPAPSALEPIIDEAFAEAGEGQRRTLAVLVLHKGKLVVERYADNVGFMTPLQGWSMNKSLMSTWVGMQVARGELDITLPLAPMIEKENPELARNIDPALNLGHLLHMESGLDFEETYFPGDDATRMLYRSSAMWTVAPGNGHRHAPGEHFSYSSGDTNLASWIWQQSLGRPYSDWLRDSFTSQIGVGRMISEHDASGIQVGSSYTYMSARDWLNVGRFWLAAWHRDVDLLPDGWMREATVPRASAAEGNYGRGFWLNAQGRDFPNLPRNLFYASGHNGQYVVVFPDEEIVVVRLGLSSGSRATGITPLLEGVLAMLPAQDPPAVAQPAGQ